MTTNDIRKLLENATPGPYKVYGDGPFGCMYMDDDSCHSRLFGLVEKAADVQLLCHAPLLAQAALDAMEKLDTLPKPIFSCLCADRTNCKDTIGCPHSPISWAGKHMKIVGCSPHYGEKEFKEEWDIPALIAEARCRTIEDAVKKLKEYQTAYKQITIPNYDFDRGLDMAIKVIV